MVLLGVVVGQAGNTLAAFPRGHSKVHGQVVSDVHAVRADGIAALGVLPEEGPVNALLRHLNRAHIGKQVQLFTHCHIGRLHIGPRIPGAGRGGGAFQNYIAGFQLGQHIVRNGLVARCTVLNGQAVDLLKPDLAAGHFVLQQERQHTLALLGNDGADTVAAANTDHNGVQRVKVGKVLILANSLGAGQLALHQGAELFYCRVNGLFLISHNGSPICKIAYLLLSLV